MRLIQSLLLFSCSILAFSSLAQEDDQRIVSSYYEFEEGSIEYLYGDNVVLRAGPSSSDKALDTLIIGTEIEIVRKTEEKSYFNGLEWNWYKVKVEGKTGYILAGLIALDHLRYDDMHYLVTVAGIKLITEEYEYIDYNVRTRALGPSGEFFGHESKLNTNSFWITAFGNRGLDGIGHMLRISLNAEACGVDAGEIYLFNDGIRLIEAISLSNVSDAGAFWFREKIIFPEDEGGWKGVVQYEREYGEYMSEELDWSKATVHSLILKWENEQFTPNVEELDFGDDD